ncbi:hypothetical protein [Idiomarina sp. UBA4206]|uniref:hypothetical protein n=1 Tax=Idiomarina sp. UBA4206 TaxID=1946644 RepID=UPI0025800FC1|nr:hypothetical protein [Idiomarina sp. UBA4206]
MKTLIVYIHLIAACISIGILLNQDLALAKSLGKPLSKTAIQELSKSADVMFVALVALWISGLTLVVMGYLDAPQQYLLNEKLWAKYTVVSILTLNGLLLHFFSFARITSPSGLLTFSAHEQILVVITGAISSVSWLFACYLGIARNWNHNVSYEFVMTVYGAFLFIAFLVAGSVLYNLHRKDSCEFPQNFYS